LRQNDSEKKHRGLRSGTDIACAARANKISVLIEKAATDARLRPSRDGPTNHEFTSVNAGDDGAVGVAWASVLVLGIG